MHYVISLLFLALFMGMAAAYFLGGYCLLRSLPYLVQRVKKRGELFFKVSFKKLLISCFTVAVIAFLPVYITSRMEWCGDDNAHLTAKQYFVVGQPLCGMRLILTKVLNPDNPILWPLNGLQHLIYWQGTRYLPENDGEIGVWNDLWFNYPFIHRSHKPYGTDDRKPSYRMRKLLDSIWFSMEQMSTKPFADKQMEEEQYFRNFPRMAFYYTVNDAYYHDHLIGSRNDLLQKVKFVNYTKLLSYWVISLRERWIKVGIYDKIKQKTPKIEVLRQQVLISSLGDLIEATIYPGNFRCSDPNISLYIEARREFTDSAATNYVWESYHRQEKRQAETLYGVAIDTVGSSFQKYIIEHYCGMDVPGEEKFFSYDAVLKDYLKKTRTSKIKSVFRDELKIIEETNHGHENR